MGESRALRALEKENDKLRERVKQLKEILIEYGRHSPGCSAQYDDKKYPCRCGWDRERKG